MLSRSRAATVKSFTGDGVMALFGVPQAFEDAPLRACRAALVIQERLAREAAEIEQDFGIRPELRVGINAGPAVVGRVEAGAEASVTALGDTINLAARLQAVAEPGSVVLSDAAQKLVEGLVESRYAGAHQMKGKAEAQRVHRLIAMREGIHRFDAAVSRGLTDYVGRDRELEALERRMAEAGVGIQVIDIAGEPGIGKSRLLHEFRQRIADARAFVLSGSCSPTDRQTPFLPFIEVVRGAFRLSSGEAESAVTRKLEDGLRVLGLASGQNVGLLLNLLGLKAPEPALHDMDAALIGWRTRDLLQRLLQARCELSPVVMAIEDLHWIDNASEQLLGQIITGAETLPLLIVHTRRPEYRPPWYAAPRVLPLPLDPLSATETSRLIEARLGAGSLPETLRRLLTEKAEGNALFAEELASFLVERGIVRRDTAGLVFDAATVASALPASVQSLLAARVDRLSPADRTLLQAAAVIGRRFDAELLASVTEGRTVDASLAAMRALDLVHPEDKSGNYTFKHVLVRDAVYGSLLSAQRAALHLGIADAIEQRSANRLPEVAETLAYHYGLTARADKAFRYLAMTAQKCADIYSLDEADRYARQALDLLDAHPDCAVDHDVAGLMASHLHVLYEKSNFIELRRSAERYTPRIEAMGDTPQLVYIMYFHALGLAGGGDCRACEALSAKALAVAERIGDVKAKAYAMNGILHAAVFLADRPLEVMERMGAECIAQSQLVGDNAALNYAYWNVIVDHTFRGLIREARERIWTLLEAGRERDDRRALGIGYAALAMADVFAGDYSEAIEHADECMRTAVTPYERRLNAITKAAAQLAIGDAQQGMPALRDAMGAAKESGWAQIVDYGISFVGVGHVLSGRFGMGIGNIERAIADFDARGFTVGATMARMLLAQICLQMLASRVRPPLSVILMNIGTIFRVRLFGARRVEALLAEARRAAHLDDRGIVRARIDMYMGLLRIIQREPIRARQFLETARTLAERQGAARCIAEIDTALAELR